MSIIYIDNFRGFKDTFVNLKDVNFFVGENSTGKTSILKLFKSLSNKKFLDLNIYNSFSEIGTHYDIVYKGSNDHKFKVGYIIKGSYVLVEVVPNKNNSIISKINVFYKNTNVEFVFFANGRPLSENHGIVPEFLSVAYKYQEIKLNNVPFESWIGIINNDGFANVEADSGFSEDSFALDFPLPTLAFIGNRKNNVDGTKRSTEDAVPLFSILNSSPIPELAWIDPIRAEPKRLYDELSGVYSPTGGHAPYLIKQMLADKKKKNKLRIKSFLNFGASSGLFSEIIARSFDKDDDSSPFELLVQLGKKILKINNVGYGVSQVLPLVAEVMHRDADTWFAIQQPEVHLHPKAQAAFGDFIFDFADNDKKNFLIETHSDFLIDRFRLAINRKYSPRKKEKFKAQVCFFERQNGYNTISYIEIMPDGSYSMSQPDSFREFFLKEQMELLSL